TTREKAMRAAWRHPSSQSQPGRKRRVPPLEVPARLGTGADGRIPRPSAGRTGPDAPVSSRLRRLGFTEHGAGAIQNVSAGLNIVDVLGRDLVGRSRHGPTVLMRVSPRFHAHAVVAGSEDQIAKTDVGRSS